MVQYKKYLKNLGSIEMCSVVTADFFLFLAYYFFACKIDVVGCTTGR